MRVPPASRPPHIVHVLPWPNVGGTEIATLRLIRAAAAHGVDASVLHRGEAAPVRALFEDAGVPTYTYVPPTPSYRHAPRYVSSSRQIARQLRAMNADAVHCADVTAAFHVALAARFAGIPVVSHVRNRYREFPRRLRPLLALVDKFVFVSHQTWTEFGHRVGPAKGEVLYDGVALRPADPIARESCRAELGIPSDALVTGMVARVARQKDLETFAHAAAAVISTRRDSWFVIVGDYQEPPHREYYEEIRDLLFQLGIADRFVFTGYRPDVPRWLSAFDLFVLSTHWEGFPLVILEAMGAGLPVVATAVDGIPEVVVSGETGCLVPHQDSGALAEALALLLSDRRSLQQLGAQARRRIEDKFGEERFRQDVGALYEAILPERSRLAS